MPKWGLTQDEFKEAIVKFESEPKTEENYMQFLLAVRKVFSQGIGLGGTQISAAVHEALEELELPQPMKITLRTVED